MVSMKRIITDLCKVTFAFILLFLTSCGGSNVISESALLQRTSSDTKAEKLNVELAQKGSDLKKTFSSADYKIGSEDLLEITVFQANELNTVARVSASGYIKLPLIDKIEASGLTVYELESLICKKLERYLTEPVVSVFVKEYRSQQIAVLGSVKNPGVYYATGQRYLLDLLSMAGGLSPEAGDIWRQMLRQSLEKLRFELAEDPFEHNIFAVIRGTNPPLDRAPARRLGGNDFCHPSPFGARQTVLE